MMRSALLIALLFAGSCNKQPPKGDLPPDPGLQATVPSAPAAPSAPAMAATPPPNPHAGMAVGMPGRTAPTSLDRLPDGRLALGPFSVVAPADWTMKPTTSSMRAATFQLPGKPGAEAELIVYYFGGDGAGGVEDNIDRWLGQIQQPDGKPSREVAKIEKTQFAGQEATFVSVAGRYAAAAMGPTPAVDVPDAEMLAAIVASPSGPYYFKLVGAKATVEANAKAFRTMLESLKIR